MSLFDQLLPAGPDRNVSEIYLCVAVNKDGKEGIVAGGSGGMIYPMFASNPESVRKMTPMAAAACAEQGCDLKVYRYGSRVDVTAEFPTEPPKKDACQRADELSKIAPDELPALLKEFSASFVQQHGLTFNALHRAYSIYSQLAEGLDCADERCRPRADDRHWFAQRRAKP